MLYPIDGPWDVQEVDDGLIQVVYSVAPYADGTIAHTITPEICRIESGDIDRNRKLAAKIRCTPDLVDMVEKLRNLAWELQHVLPLYQHPENTMGLLDESGDLLDLAKGGN